MSKSDIVSAQKAAIASAQDAALEAGLGACYDQGAADQVPVAGLSQADIDAAVIKAKAECADEMAIQAGNDAQALADAHAAAQVELDAMKAKDDADVASCSALQSKLDAIKALLA